MCPVLGYMFHLLLHWIFPSYLPFIFSPVTIQLILRMWLDYFLAERRDRRSSFDLEHVAFKFPKWIGNSLENGLIIPFYWVTCTSGTAAQYYPRRLIAVPMFQEHTRDIGCCSYMIQWSNHGRRAVWYISANHRHIGQPLLVHVSVFVPGSTFLSDNPALWGFAILY